MLARGFAELDNAGSRQAFLHTLRAVVEPGGQRVSANSRLALAASLPALIVWGENDSIIPVAHGAAAHEAMPGSRFVVFEDAGHLPQEAQPRRFAALLTEFCDATEPARLTARPLAAAAGGGDMSAERLSALDASFLAVESPTAPMHVGWVSSFDPPQDAPRPGFDELFDHLAGRLAIAPRYRQKLASVPLGVHEPMWVDDPDFDPAAHLLHAEGDDLDEIADAIFSTPLPRDRPLWQMWIADGLPDGRLAMIGKMHHCMVDGIAVVELGEMLLDAEPRRRRRAARRAADGEPGRRRRRPRRARGWPARSPTARPTAPRSRSRRPARRVTAPPARPPRAREPRRADALADPAAARARLLAQPPGLGPAPPRPRVAVARRPADAAAPLRRDAQRRRAGHLRGRAAALRVAARRVAAGAQGDGAGRRARRARRGGRQPHLVRVHRSAVRRAGPGRPPRGGPPRDSQRGRDGAAEDLDAAFRALALAPGPVQRTLAHAFAHPRMSNLTISSVPGPAVPRYLYGCRLREVHSAVPLAERHALSIGVVMVAGRVCFGIYADAETLPDADALREDLDAAFEELLAEA